MNALYTGYSKVPILMGQYTTTYVVHYYNQVEGNSQKLIIFRLYLFIYKQFIAWHNLLGHQRGVMSIVNWLRYLYWAKNQRKKFLQYYLFKNYGPPTYKFMRRFPALKDFVNIIIYSVKRRGVEEREKI